MDDELDLLLGTVIDDLTKLMLVLDLHRVPGSARSPAEIAVGARVPPEQAATALAHLAAAGLIERFRLGTGRLTMYGPSEDEHIQAILGLLHDRYHSGPEARAHVVRRVLKLGARPGEDPQE